MLAATPYGMTIPMPMRRRFDRSHIYSGVRTGRGNRLYMFDPSMYEGGEQTGYYPPAWNDWGFGGANLACQDCYGFKLLGDTSVDQPSTSFKVAAIAGAGLVVASILAVAFLGGKGK